VKSDPIEGLADGGAIAGDAQVAREGQVRAAAGGRAVHGGDHGLGRLADAGDDVAAGIDEGRQGSLVTRVGQPLQVRDIGARAEAAPCTRDDQHADVLLLREPGDRFRDLLTHPSGEGVQARRAVQREGTDPVADVDQDVLVPHGLHR
jgi:hypothetical protein